MLAGKKENAQEKQGVWDLGVYSKAEMSGEEEAFGKLGALDWWTSWSAGEIFNLDQTMRKQGPHSSFLNLANI